MRETTLIVSEGSPTATDLWGALTAMGLATLMRTPQWVLAESWSAESVPDVLLVDAALDLATMRGLVQRLVDVARRPPAVLCFAPRDGAELASHVNGGLDYLLAPFPPHLLRRRLDTLRQHRDLDLAVRSMVAAADTERFERELQIGREIQQGFLPESLPLIPGWNIAAHFAPAREVSGDFYDAYDVVNGSLLGIVIADVCDKGIGAALFMALIRSLLRHAAVSGIGTDVPTPADDAPHPVASANLAVRAVRTTNDYLTTNHLHQAYFATLFFGVIDPESGGLVYINCGHNPPVIRRADGGQLLLMPTGPALGLIHDAQFDLGRETLHAGDLLFLYTDGVTEAKSADGEFFGEERLWALLREPGTAAAVVERLRAAVIAHAGTAAQFDDVTMLGLHRQPAARAGPEAARQSGGPASAAATGSGTRR